jgi:ABC-type multidrug transport system fused ATPase/permease subunit
MVGWTTIAIAHRLSTIRSADVIVVLAGNRIANTGMHEELMAREGVYRHLKEVKTQIGPQQEPVKTRRGWAVAAAD